MESFNTYCLSCQARASISSLPELDLKASTVPVGCFFLEMRDAGMPLRFETSVAVGS